MKLDENTVILLDTTLKFFVSVHLSNNFA